MEQPSSLASALAECRDANSEWTPVYEEFVAQLRAGDVASSAPKVGDVFPDFALPDENGRYRSLSTLAAAAPLVLSFNRGGWCPFCRGELTAWGERAGDLKAAGGHFVTLTGEVGGQAARLHDMVGPDATVLVDIDHGFALSVGLVFRCNDDMRRRYLECGLDLAEIYGGAGWLLPVPATFVVARDLTVRYAFVDPDFRNRAEPDDVISQVKALR